MRGHPAGELLRKAVRLRGIKLGETVDLIVDRDRSRVLGFDVLCGDDVHRFLPFAAASVAGGGVQVESTLILLDPGEWSFYRSNGLSLVGDGELSGASIDEHGGVVLGNS